MTSTGSADDLKARKRELRSLSRRARAALEPSERLLRSRALQARLMQLPQLRGSGTIALYAALPDEVQLDELDPWLRAGGWRVVYPRVEQDELRLHEVHSLAALNAGAGRFRAPGPGAPIVAVDALDVIIVPGLLFDRRGQRLGRGGGHYDRLLVRLHPRTLSIGVCFTEALVSGLPCEPHDVPVRSVVTDREHFWPA